VCKVAAWCGCRTLVAAWFAAVWFRSLQLDNHRNESNCPQSTHEMKKEEEKQ